MVPLKTAKADLIGKYKRHLKISFILSISLVILAFKFSPMPGKFEPIKVDNDEIIKITEIDPTTQKPKVPEPPKAPEIIPAELDNEIEDIVLQDVGIFENVPTGTPGPPTDDKPIIEDDKIFEAVEENPEIIGGIAELQKKVYYTEIARKAGIEGTVVIEAIVDKKGNVTDVSVKKSIGGGLDDVALKAVLNTKFKPGMQRGKPVNVRMWIPIKFVLRKIQ